MIWGSQYDAMLNFALNGTDIEKVTATTNGNHAVRILKTGLTKTSDSINNIYDLEGNMWEWSLEASSPYGRVTRGGYYYDSISPSNRYGYSPSYTSVSHGSRLSLYIK